MDLLLLRAAIAPVLVLLASLLARRLGPGVGGQLLGAPTTTGPFLAVTWLASGPQQAATAAHGTATGMLGVASFCVAYARLAPTRPAARTLPLALACAAGAALVGVGCGDVRLSATLGFAVIVIGLLTWPAVSSGARLPRRATRWEIPARMALSAVTVAAALAAATALGSFVGGLLSALPVLLSVMGASTHRTAGGPAATDMMRGALTSTAGTLGFLLVLCFAPAHLGLVAAFVLALTALVACDRLVRLCVARATAIHGPSGA